MPEDLWVTGDLIDEDRLNNIERSLVIQCTAATHPTDPETGMTIAETDTFETKQYSTATVGFTRPWRMPWGVLGQGANTDRHDGVSGAIIPVAANGFVAPKNRLLNIHWEITYVASTDAGFGASPRFTVQVDTGSGLTDIGDPGTAGTCAYILDGVPVTAAYHPAAKTVSFATPAAATYSFALKAESVSSGGGTAIDIRGDIATTRIEVMDVGAWDNPEP